MIPSGVGGVSGRKLQSQTSFWQMQWVGRLMVGVQSIRKEVSLHTLGVGLGVRGGTIRASSTGGPVYETGGARYALVALIISKGGFSMDRDQ